MVGRELLTGAFAEGLTTSVGMSKWISCKVNAGQSEGLVNDEVSGQGTLRGKDAEEEKGSERNRSDIHQWREKEGSEVARREARESTSK